jgi:hypothetical protein
MAKKPITEVKKTRLMTNKEGNSYRLDVIHINNEIDIFHFDTKKEALNFQNFLNNLNKFKHFI